MNTEQIKQEIRDLKALIDRNETRLDNAYAAGQYELANNLTIGINKKQDTLDKLYAQLDRLQQSAGVVSNEEMKELAVSLQSLEITPKNQTTASSFSSCQSQGFGSLPSYTEYDPTYYLNEKSLTYRLIPTEDEIQFASPFLIYGERIGLQSRGETETGGIRDQLIEYFAINHSSIASPGQTQLKTRKIGEGIVLTSSYEDAHVCIGGYYLAVFEFKGGESSILAAIAQAAATGTNFALTLLSYGLSPNECIVPIIAINGITITFGATIILQNTFPTYIPISKHLLLSHSIESKIASAYLHKLVIHCEAMRNLLPQIPPKSSNMNMELVTNDNLWVKSIILEVYQRGLGLFHNDSRNQFYIDPGLRHMIHTLNKVYNCESSRQYAEYPISIRTPNNYTNGCYQLIFRNLSKLGFSIGAPNRMTQEELFNEYVDALKYAVDQIHYAGVIHVDLYLSNVMWRKLSLNNPIEIKIIDWDASHSIEEGDFHPNIKAKLLQYLGRHPIFGSEHDNLYLKIFDLQKDENGEFWGKLASNNKEEVDQAFRALFQQILDQPY